MSYSRWSDSDWYTFWCVAAEGEDPLADPVLACWYVGGPHHDLRFSQLDGATKEAVVALLPGVPVEHVDDELMGYIGEFLSDVREKRAQKEARRG